SIDDVSMHDRVLQQAVAGIKEFAPEGQRKRLTKILSTALMDGLVQLEPGSDRQRSVARALAILSQDTDSLAADLSFLLAGDEASQPSGDLQIDDEMRWLPLIGLSSLERMDMIRLDDDLPAAHTAASELYYRTAVAALPDQAQRTALWVQ